MYKKYIQVPRAFKGLQRTTTLILFPLMSNNINKGCQYECLFNFKIKKKKKQKNKKKQRNKRKKESTNEIE